MCIDSTQVYIQTFFQHAPIDSDKQTKDQTDKRPKQIKDKKTEAEVQDMTLPIKQSCATTN